MAKKKKVLVCDAISDQGMEKLTKSFDVTVKTGQTEAQLVKIAASYDAMVVRSQTKITAPIFEAAKNCRIVGRAGVGVDNIDIPAATRCGVIVVNSPMGNTLAAAEHTFALIMAMSRNIPQADRSMRRGEWERKKYVGTELFGKTLAVVGLGKIGATVARRAKAFGMDIKVFDPYASDDLLATLEAERFEDLDKLLPLADYVTVHVPKSPQTLGMIGKKQFGLMKKTARVVNCSRGGIVDEKDLYEALSKKKIAGAALDVYTSEPPEELPHIDLENIVLTPHLGASTTEAQENVVIDIAEQIDDYFSGRPVKYAVNLPPLDPEDLKKVAPLCGLAEKIGFLQASLVEDPIKSISVEYLGEYADLETSYLTRFVLVGALKPAFQDSVNVVNANLLAQERKLKVQDVKNRECSGYSGMIRVTVDAGDRKHAIAGVMYNGGDPYIVQISAYPVHFAPEGAVILIRNTDKPGVVGSVGTTLGKEKINIAEMRLGRGGKVGSEAIMALSVDGPIKNQDAVVAKLLKIPGVKKAKVVNF